MRTTIDLPDPLYKQVKTLAAMRGLKLKELITRALTQYVRHADTKEMASEVPEVTAAELETLGDPETLQATYPRGYRIVGPLIARPAGEILPNLTNAALTKMMEEEDLDRNEVAG